MPASPLTARIVILPPAGGASPRLPPLHLAVPPGHCVAVPPFTRPQRQLAMQPVGGADERSPLLYRVQVWV